MPTDLKPTPTERLDQSILLLSRTPAALDSFLRGLPEALTLANEGPDTWSPFEVVAHLIHCERTDWMPRARLILGASDHSSPRSFEPFDRLGNLRESQGKPMEELLDEFASWRARNLDDLRAMRLSQDQLALQGLHPAFGPVTLSQLLAAWAAHDLTHLHQISRVLAFQYRDAVGPWRRFLGVMQRGGHSAAS